MAPRWGEAKWPDPAWAAVPLHFTLASYASHSRRVANTFSYGALKREKGKTKDDRGGCTGFEDGAGLEPSSKGMDCVQKRLANLYQRHG